MLNDSDAATMAKRSGGIVTYVVAVGHSKRSRPPLSSWGLMTLMLLLSRRMALPLRGDYSLRTPTWSTVKMTALLSRFLAFELTLLEEGTARMLP